MLILKPKQGRGLSWLKKAIFADIVLCGIAYFGWTKLNGSRDFRFYCYENHRFILEAYYKIGETFDPDYKQRELDYQHWLRSKQIQF